MSDLPPQVKRDLDQAAAGIGRVATGAHPDCVCHKVYLPACHQCGAAEDAPCVRVVREHYTLEPPCAYWRQQHRPLKGEK